MMAGGPVWWQSSKQTTVAQSSTEAEYIAANEAARLIMATRNLLAELHFPQPHATPLFIDNRTSIRMALEDGQHARRKHINVKHHYIRELIENESISVHWISTENQLADLLTKALPRDTFKTLRDKAMGLQSNSDAVSQLPSFSHGSGARTKACASSAVAVTSSVS